MLTHIHIRRIRSVFFEDLPLAPLTLLVGPNGAGKSNVIRATFLCSLLSRRLLAARPEDVDEVEYVYMDAPFDRTEIYAYSRVPETRVELKLEQGYFRLDYSPERKRSYVRYVVSPSGRRSRRAVVKAVAGIRYISTDRLIRWDIEAESIEMEEEELITGNELLRSLGRISRSRTKSKIFTEMGQSLFGVRWESLLERPEDMQFVDAAIGPTGVRLPFHLGSLGTRQFFPILVHSLAMARGGILMAEEPEISLHPAAQVRVGEYLASVARGGVQLIVSTHSHYLLLGICKQVRASTISPDDVAILNCAKTAYGTKVARLPMDNSGRIDGWIPSFSEVDDYLFEDWVKSVGEADE